MEKDYSKMQLEDKALKSATMYFGQELLSYFNISGKILRMLPTEQIRLEAVKAEEDTLFEMEDGTLAHFEYESVEINEDDLRRFRCYEANSSRFYKKPVITYVICSGNVTRIKSELSEGINPYRIIPLQMKQKNADAWFAKLDEKTSHGEKLSKEDLAPLLLTPLMAGESSTKERILKAEKLLGTADSLLGKEEKRHMEGILYAFACKFLKGKDLNEVKEALSMTVLGEMIWNDGREQGLMEGRLEGRKEWRIKLIRSVCRKLQKGKDAIEIAEDLEEELSVVEQICDAANRCAPEYDCEEIYRLLES